MRFTSEYFDAYGEFNPVRYLVDSCESKKIEAIKIDCDFRCDSSEILKKVKKFNFDSAVKTEYVIHNHEKHDYLINDTNDCVIDLSALANYPTEQGGENPEAKIKIFYSGNTRADIKSIKKTLNSYLKEVKEKKYNKQISFLVQDEEGYLSLIDRELKEVDIDLQNNYNTSFDLDKIIDKLENDSSGLMLFTGNPGSGKTFLIKHLASISSKRFVFCPVDLVGVLATPSFLRFAISKFKDCVLVVEDGETCLMDRNESRNSAASTLLNLTDGILGDLIGIKIIATVNNENKIDDALLRNGRLIAKVEFKALPVEKANKVLERLGKTERVDDDKMLCDLYAIDNDNGYQKKERRKVGF